MKTLLPILKTKLFLLGFVSTCTVILATTVPQIRNFIAPEKMIGEKITAEQKKITPKIKKQNKTVSASRVTSDLSLEMNNSFEATVTSDAPDYAPLSTATFTGAGFAPNEDVVLKVKNLFQACHTVSADSSYLPWTVTADNDGHFETTWTVCNCPGDSLRLRAVGETSHDTAYLYFSDDVSVTPATGGTNISADKAANAISPAYTNITLVTPISIKEANGSGGRDDFHTNVTQITLNAPSGWEFQNSGVTVGGSHSDITVGAVGYPNSTTITIALTVNSITNNDEITISGVFVRATNGADLSNNGNITPTWTGIIDVLTTASNLGTLSQTFGALNKLVVTLPSQTFTDGSTVATSGNSGSVTAQTVSTPFNISKLTATDQFFNIVTSFTGSKTISYSGPGSGSVAPTYTTTVSFTSGQSTTTLATTLTKAETTTITATNAAAPVSGPASSSLVVNAANTTTTLTSGTNPTCVGGSTLLTATVSPSAATESVEFFDGVSSLGTSPVSSGVATKSVSSLTFGPHTLTVVYSGDANYNTSTSLGVNQNVNDKPSIAAISTPAAFCVGGSLNPTTPIVTPNGAPLSLQSWQLETAVGSGTFSNITVPYTVVFADNGKKIRYSATNSCGTTTSNEVVLTVNDKPTIAAISTPAALCAGGSLNPTTPTVTANGSTVTSQSWQLETAVASGIFSDITVPYTVAFADNGKKIRYSATNGCGTTNSNQVTLTVNDKPTIATIPTPAPRCAGVSLNPTTPTITANGSTVTSQSWQLETAVGSGTFSNITVPYTVAFADNGKKIRYSATNGCGTTNSNEVVVTVNPLPAIFNVGFTGSLCGTATITLSGSETGVNYQLYKGNSTEGSPVAGTGSALSFGQFSGNSLYTVVATNAAGCTNDMSGSVDLGNGTEPNTFNVTGGGSYCLGGAGVAVGLSSSENGVTYQLYLGANPVGSPVPGTGNAISFGNQTAVGTYKVIGTRTNGTGCAKDMNGTVQVSIDQTPPTISANGTTTTLGCNPSAPDINAALGSASASDNCGTPTVTQADGAVTGDCNKSQTRTFTATDNTGKTASTFRTVTWKEDHDAPVITATGSVANNADLGCNPSAATINAALGSATASDHCDGLVSVTPSDGAVTGDCNKSQTRTWTTTDICGNTSSASRTITWTVDVTKPVFTGSYTAIDLDCNPTAAEIQAALGSATATDGCSTPTVDNGVDGNVSTDNCQRSQTRTFTATDHCGNTQTASRTVTWTVDITKPVFTGSYTAIDLDCNPTAAEIQAALGSATATDGCSTPTVNNGVDGSVSTNYCQRSQTRTFTATDHCGNTQTASRTVSWIVDVTKPVFTGSYTAIDLDCNPTAAEIQAALGSATATDGCSTPTVNNGVDGSVSTDNCQRSQTRTFTATDHCSNTQTASRTVTWTVDITKPVFTGSYTAIDLDCNPTAAEIQAALGSATATDGCSTPTVNNGVDGSVSTDNCQRSQTRTFTATDHCGNTQTASRTVTWTVDVTKPVFTGSYTAIDLDCNPTAAEIQAALGSATATDGCSTPTVNNGVDGSVSTNYCQRSQTRTFTATDHCGNTQTASRTVTWTVDITKPVFTGSYTAIDLDCNPTAAEIQAALGSATATDGCSTPTVNNGVDGSVSTDNCQRSQTRTFTATDHCGNTQTASRTVTWTVDVTKPVFTGSYTAIDLDCNPTAAEIQAALGSATATDGCSTPTVNNGVDGNVSTNYCQRSQTRTFTATDHCGNTQTASRTVTWTVDITKPVFTGSYTAIDLDCNPTAAEIQAALGSATATDGCSTPTVDNGVDGSVSTDNCQRSQTRTFTATDHCGNTQTASRTVTWTVDVTKPVFTGNYTAIGLDCNPTAAEIQAALGSATATDGCSTPTVNNGVDGNVSTNYCQRSQTRTFTATDHCGNTQTASRTVTWTVDITKPVFTGSYTAIDLDCNPTAAEIQAALGSATATDGCSTPTVDNGVDGSVSTDNCQRSQTRTFTATDHCGNTQTASRTVTWTVDVTKPVFTGSYTAIDLDCNPTAAEIQAALGSATATDGCSTPTVNNGVDGNVSTNYCQRSQTRTFTATDHCGNTSTASRTARWTYDVTPPNFTSNFDDVQLGCNPGAGAIETALGSATANDACGTPTVTSTDGALQSNGCLRSITRTFTAKDGCNNTTTSSRTARWTYDVTPPTFAAGTITSITIFLCNPSFGEINTALGTVSATDACSTATITSSDGPLVAFDCIRFQSRTFLATDACGNTSAIVRTVTWTSDVTAPVLSLTTAPALSTCNPSAADVNASLGTATATDGCGTPAVTFSDNAVTSTNCSRSQTRTFTAIDNCGNTSSTSRTVIWTSDVAAPVLSLTSAPGLSTCNPSAADVNASLGTATATDGCGTPTVTFSDNAVQSNNCSRSQTRTFKATDYCGNTSTTSRTVNWTYDVTAPILSLTTAPGLSTCNPSAADVNASLGTATATDGCGTPTVTFSDNAVQSNNCSRSQTRTFKATDYCGNTSTTSRTVNWTYDVTAPTLSLTSAPAIVTCNPSATDIDASLGTATATDGCGTPTVTFADGAVQTTGCSRTQKRTFTARDGCNNTSTVSRTVTWTSDLTPPTITGPLLNKTSLWPPNHKMVDVELIATSSDNCGLMPTSTDDIVITSNEPENDIGDGNTEKDWEIVDNNTIRLRAERSGVNALNPDDPGRIYTVKYKVSDACGNTSTVSGTVMVAHNITSPNVGNSIKVGTTVSLGGTFWDVPGNTHTAKWLIDAATVNGTIVSEPVGNKMGKVSGSYKPTAAGIYKLRMNVTDQKGVTGYATTNGDYEAFLVCYDPNGGYTYGGGKFVSPANAAISNPGMTGEVAFGFASNYFKNATNPKGETELVFKDGGVEFNAVNYDVLVVDPTKSKATYKGLGKTIINGVEQSGYAFLMVVIDGKTTSNPNGVDKIRIKIYNKNTLAIIYDNQPGAPDDADPVTPVANPLPDGCDIVVVNTPAGTSADITQNAQMEVTPLEITKFNVKVFPNPSQDQFSLYLEGANNDKVHIIVYDALGREVKKFEKEGGNIPVIFGRDLKGGSYFVEVRQGDNHKTVKLIKQN